MCEPCIVFDNISFSYDQDTPIINNLSLEINRGDRVVLKGESGSGKTTFSGCC